MPIKFPCNICNKPCKLNQRSIACDICHKWTHLKCSSLTNHEFVILGNCDAPYYCIVCIENLLPFQKLTDIEFDELFTVKDRPLLSNSINNNSLFDAPYLALSYFKSENEKSKDFSLIHINICSMTKNLDHLNRLLNEIGMQPDIIAISETRLNKNSSQMCMNGYNFLHGDSNSKAGGVGMHIKQKYALIPVDKCNLNLEGCED